MKIKGATLRGLVKDLPKSLGLKKKTPQTEKLRDAFWGHFAHAFYEEAHKAFITKSKGGTDESGMKWKPLSEKTKRKCYGMEIDPHYCDVIVKRWEDYTGNKAERFEAANA